MEIRRNPNESKNRLIRAIKFFEEYRTSPTNRRQSTLDRSLVLFSGITRIFKAFIDRFDDDVSVSRMFSNFCEKTNEKVGSGRRDRSDQREKDFSDDDAMNASPLLF